MPVNTYTQLAKYDKKYKRNTEWKFNMRSFSIENPFLLDIKRV